MRVPMVSRISGVRKIVVSSDNTADGCANHYHVKVYFDNIDGLVKAAKRRESRVNISFAS